LIYKALITCKLRFRHRAFCV